MNWIRIIGVNQVSKLHTAAKKIHMLRFLYPLWDLSPLLRRALKTAFTVLSFLMLLRMKGPVIIFSLSFRVHSCTVTWFGLFASLIVYIVPMTFSCGECLGATPHPSTPWATVMQWCKMFALGSRHWLGKLSFDMPSHTPDAVPGRSDQLPVSQCQLTSAS